MKTKVDFPTINAKSPDGQKDDGTPYRVLIVDDSMFVTKQIGQILTSEGFEVVGTAGDGLGDRAHEHLRHHVVVWPVAVAQHAARAADEGVHHG